MPILQKGIFSRAVWIDLLDRSRRRDLREALGRALNCWEKAPVWLVRLYDELKKEV